MQTNTPLPELVAQVVAACDGDDLAVLALGGVILQALAAKRRPLIRGLSEARFQKLLNESFDDLAFANGDTETSASSSAPADEFDELLALLLEHRVSPGEKEAWLAYAVATAAMGQNHLWQDMGLPSRKHLSRFMTAYFPTLAALNSGDMKWKKFFYRQLCERAEVPICKSPSCAQCCDYGVCFGGES